MKEESQSTVCDPLPEAPVIWLLGKTQAGKTSIVAEITGQAAHEVGNGFVPVTRHASVYDFPPEQPVVRFLDTRGLEDFHDYDPAPDLAEARKRSHVTLVVVRANDTSIDAIVDVLATIRKSKSDWPVIVAQTCLHHCYEQSPAHAWPYPFQGTAEDFTANAAEQRLGRALAEQRKRFSRIPGRSLVFVPIDFTTPDHALPPTNYGVDALWKALEAEVPTAMNRIPRSNDLRLKVILPWALAAASTNAVPIPVLGGLGSASAQAMMVRQLAQRLGYPFGLDQWKAFCSTLGTGFVLGFGGSWISQQVLKLAPVAGSAAVATWTFAITWGIGEAALKFLQSQAAGTPATRDELNQAYKDAMKQARDYYKNWRRERGQQSA
ncbi:MAG: 50S ribosome-binding GTPase [Rhodocyclaceae bacterium]|nr:50S ribosome-binding GTPase [Rhodocyclaceae bacterium]